MCVCACVGACVCSCVLVCVCVCACACACACVHVCVCACVCACVCVCVCVRACVCNKYKCILTHTIAVYTLHVNKSTIWNMYIAPPGKAIIIHVYLYMLTYDIVFVYVTFESYSTIITITIVYEVLPMVAYVYPYVCLYCVNTFHAITFDGV